MSGNRPSEEPHRPGEGGASDHGLDTKMILVIVLVAVSAITILVIVGLVIVAAIAGAFVLGIGGATDAGPGASLDFASPGGTVTVGHGGGDAIDPPRSSSSSTGSPPAPGPTSAPGVVAR